MKSTLQFISSGYAKLIRRFVSIVIFTSSIATMCHAQGTWTPLNTTAPDGNYGVMLLLTDGSVMVRVYGAADTAYGVAWDKLAPDATGSYVNGTWSSLSPMMYDRLYFSTQVLQNGKVYVAGGEYGSGGPYAELYDPITNSWSLIPMPPGDTLDDANSQLLPDGRVLQNIVDSGGVSPYTNIIYDPVANSYSQAARCIGDPDESIWIKLPDSSILFADNYSRRSERYFPSLHEWKQDATIPVSLYNQGETGSGLNLPDGTVFLTGGNGTTAIYTPSGDTTAGQWASGPLIPNGNAVNDAPMAMMADGNALCIVSPVPNGSNPSDTPTYFYEYNYANQSFNSISAPDGTASWPVSSYIFQMLDLPDGTMLLSSLTSSQYYIYTPAHPPLASGKPTVSEVHQTGCQYMITGTLFNGISQGAAYGDDWQMATNYPIVRLVSGGKTYYARTTNWNSTGIQTGSLPDTAYFTLPSIVPNGNYSLLLSANGISSDSFSFSYVSCHTGINDISGAGIELKAAPNPAHDQTALTFSTDRAGDYTISLTDIFGRSILNEHSKAIQGINTQTLNFTGMAKGIYIATLEKDGQNYMVKIVVE